MSLSSVCRLCLYNSDEYIELTLSNPDKLREKIEKFLYVEIEDDDPFPKSVCRKCIDRLRLFHDFYLEVAQNQEILQFSAPNSACVGQQVIIKNERIRANESIESTTEAVPTPSTQTEIIHLPPDFNFKENSFVFTVQTAPMPLSVVDDGANTTTILMHGDAMSDGTITEFVESQQNFMEAMTMTPNEVTVETEKEADEEIFAATISMEKQKMIRAKSISIRPQKKSTRANVVAKAEKTQKIQNSPRKPRKCKSEFRREAVSSLRSSKQLTVIKEELENIVHNQDSEDEEDINDIDADYTVSNNLEQNAETTILDTDNEKFEGFPKCIIINSKLIVRGKQLLEMMAQFYRLECDICPSTKSRATFTGLSDLYQHYVSEHTMKGYVSCCGLKLIKPRAMAMHMARHLQPDAFRCPECDKLLTCPKILQYHIQNHLPEEQRPLACPECPRKFSYSSAYVSHLISHQPENERAAHICDECGKSFVSAGRLTTHINVAHMLQGQDYICHICAKRFTCRSNLTYHLTTHQPKVRQEKCEKCGKWLKNKPCLRKHMLQHSGVRYNCSICNYSALNQQCLRNHIKVQHSDAKPFNCDVCDKSFKLKNTLMYHMVQHTGIRKFNCPFCSRAFASSGNYYSHRKRMHPQELAAFKLKEEEEEKKLREQVLSEKKHKS